MYGCGDGRGILADLLTHFYIVAHTDKGLAGSAYVLSHRNDYLRRRGDHGHRNFRRLHVIGMNAAFECMGHKLHLVIISLLNNITNSHKMSTQKGAKTGIFER